MRVSWRDPVAVRRQRLSHFAGDLTYSAQWQGQLPNQNLNDEFFRIVQPVATAAPLMTAPGILLVLLQIRCRRRESHLTVTGNHEQYDYNFLSYMLRIGRYSRLRYLLSIVLLF